MQITYKIRLYPNAEQEQKLLWTLDKCRLVYNWVLEGLNNQAQPNKLELQSMLLKLKEKYPELKDLYSKVLQMIVHQLFSNLGALAKLKKKGKKVGRLRFKGKGWFKTFIYNQSGFKIIKTYKRIDKLHLSKIGDISIRIYRGIEGNIKQILIKKYNSGKWYAHISVKESNRMEQKNYPECSWIGYGDKAFRSRFRWIANRKPSLLEANIEEIEERAKEIIKKKEEIQKSRKAEDKSS
jgi:putative transposase